MVVVHERGRRAEPRWLVWSRDAGRIRTPELLPATPRLVAAVAGTGPDGAQALTATLAADARSGADVVDDVLRALGLPGAGLPLGLVHAPDLPGAVRVDPDAEAVARFDDFTRTEAHLAAQLGEDR
jgi:hypothetical protein